MSLKEDYEMACPKCGQDALPGCGDLTTADDEAMIVASAKDLAYRAFMQGWCSAEDHANRTTHSTAAADEGVAEAAFHEWAVSEGIIDEPMVEHAAPQWAWDLIFETLNMDSESSAFDKDLRRRISEAINAVE